MKHTGEPERERLQEAEAAAGRGELRQRLYGTATQQMLEAAKLQPGDHVLDIAAGTGDQSRQAARLVRPEGSVLATDISQEMLDVAARLALQEGLSNITTRAMNAEQLDLPGNLYDAVISRLGLMLIPQKHRALKEIWRVLKPGGRVAALVWSKPERNPLFALYITVVEELLSTEELEEQWTDPFSLADAALFATMLTEAGFQSVQVQAIPLTFQFPSFEALTTWWGSPFDQALTKLEPEPRQRKLEEVRQHVRQFEGPHGIQAPAELLLIVSMK
ncbi:MAG TPA: class I SAM-dependent methyltransferase [Ktedonobacteraceae bacterium]|nr:class I SAM-dependent methyltransferase [Ktedonobacteraceae bacterium]